MSIRPRSSLLNPDLQRPHALKSVPRDPAHLWLDKNENVDPELMALTHEILRQIPASTLSTYPEAGELYRKLAAWCAVEPEQLLLTPGSDGAIRVVFEAFVEPGDPVIHTFPTFAMYPVYSQMFGAAVHQIEYQQRDGGPFLAIEALTRAIREHKPKLVCLPNPDSPTGTVMLPQALEALLGECEQAGSVLLLDEAYYPFYEWSAVGWTQRSPNLVIARTFAKAWGVAGLRIGYAVGRRDTIALLHKMRPMYEVSTLAVEFMTRMMEHPDAMIRSVAQIKAGKDLFVREMRALGFQVLPTNGNFVHVAFGGAGRAVHATLLNRVLYRAAGGHAALEGYSRFTVGPPAVMGRVADLIKEAKKGEA